MKRVLPIALLCSSCWYLAVGADSVPPAAPAELAYSKNPAIYTKGWQIKENTPHNDGGPANSYEISPPLPAGLSLDTTGGAISGASSALSPSTTYTVTAMNARGSTTSGLAIAVVNGAIGAGERNTCALINGAGWCWGDNSLGQLGNDSTTGSSVPVQVSNLTPGTGAITAGDLHACAAVNGAAWCWGSSSSGQLGNGSFGSSPVPIPVSGLSSGVQAIEAGKNHTCAVANGAAWCWGSNSAGQLGDNSTNDGLTPVPVSSLGSGVQAVTGGELHSCAVVNGGAQCWGANIFGELGINSAQLRSLVPVQVFGLTSGVQAIAAGAYHTCALVNGGVQCWGYNGAGQLGDNSTSDRLAPVQVLGLPPGVEAIAAGGNHTCALANGGVYCWGDNSTGQLGNDSMTAFSTMPVQVSGLTSGVEAIAVGGAHTCALITGGIRCWGYNGSGQLGNDSTTDTRVPVGISPLE